MFFGAPCAAHPYHPKQGRDCQQNDGDACHPPIVQTHAGQGCDESDDRNHVAGRHESPHQRHGHPRAAAASRRAKATGTGISIRNSAVE